MIITDHRQLRIYQEAFDLALEVYRLTKRFPADERYRLTDQSIRSSRSPCPAIAEAFRMRHYKPRFVNKIAEAEQEAAETQVWLQFAGALGFASEQHILTLDNRYSKLLARLTNTRITAPKWCQFDTRKE